MGLVCHQFAGSSPLRDLLRRRLLTLGFVRRFSIVASLAISNALVAPTPRLLRLEPGGNEEALVDLEEIDVSCSNAGSGLDELFRQCVG
jgi:hypothetical protein